jgi:prolyl-tRNA editing enzyme YbaK/EbsC (Cys-tRNA(Pro) deacylase)
MKYHQVTEDIKSELIESGSWFETFEHEPVRTSEQAAKTRPGYSLQQGAKAIIVRVKKSRKDKAYVMLVLPADLRFDNKKVKDYFGSKDVRFATEQEVLDLTGGVQVGAVPPFGNLFDLEVLADPQLLENEKIVFNAGDRRFSVAMKSEDYIKLVNPTIADITS